MHARTTRRLLRPLRISTLVLIVGLALAAPAVAAKPKHNARFSGHTSAKPVVGFLAPVTFKVAPNGLSLYNFTYGSFGCFGAGGFKPGVNPYTKNSLVDAGKLKVSASGRVSAKALVTESIGETTTTTITITAKFSTPKKISGTIQYSQVVENSFHSSCKSDPISFSASAH